MAEDYYEALLRRLRMPQIQSFDPSFDRGIRDIQLQQQQLDATQQLANQQEQTQYASDLGALNRRRDFDKERLTESLADRGTLRSGMNLEANARLGQDYQFNADALARRLGFNQQNRALEKSNFQADMSNRVSDLQADKARAEAERARVQAEGDADRQIQEIMIRDEQRRSQDMLQQQQPQWTPTGQYLPSGATFNGQPMYPEYEERR